MMLQYDLSLNEGIILVTQYCTLSGLLLSYKKCGPQIVFVYCTMKKLTQNSAVHGSWLAKVFIKHYGKGCSNYKYSIFSMATI